MFEKGRRSPSSSPGLSLRSTHLARHRSPCGTVQALKKAAATERKSRLSSSSTTSPLNLIVRSGKPPMLRVHATDDAPRWAAESRDALRAAVAEHGSLLVRGLRLRDVPE